MVKSFLRTFNQLAGDSPGLKDVSEYDGSEEPLNPKLSAPVTMPDAADFTAIEMTGRILQ